ncbi:unnamed protein product [Spirodela intermedia]|uniref:Uncharacterized protein n=1 Tax=Spirodela intermedia TaxID=51605 RepID=A0A7I8L9D2_SPIIN|nr:unnamed protein product [Spirodela intermedia]
MALSLRWYDALCFAIVAAAALGAGWLILAKVRRRRREKVNGAAGYVSLAAEGPPERRRRRSDGGAGVWVSSWTGLHPGWLLGVRVASATVMVILLACDIAEWGLLIFVYYTEILRFTTVHALVR